MLADKTDRDDNDPVTVVTRDDTHISSEVLETASATDCQAGPLAPSSSAASSPPVEQIGSADSSAADPHINSQSSLLSWLSSSTRLQGLASNPRVQVARMFVCVSLLVILTVLNKLAKF